MRKYISIIIALLLTLSVTGCGDSIKSNEGQSATNEKATISEETQNKEPKIEPKAVIDRDGVDSVYTSGDTAAVLKNDSSLWILTKVYIEKTEKVRNIRNHL